jgi:carboxypeptidase C (cathepsin A)
MRVTRSLAAVASVILALLIPVAVLAQDTRPESRTLERGAGKDRRSAPNADPQREVRSGSARLPADVSTTHTLTLRNRTLEFRATAGRIVMENAQGVADAEIAFTAFTLPDRDPRTRPIAFALNGGPGSASAWLNIGGLGPWRLPMETRDIQSSQPPVLVPNDETWLDFTDLVFVDPVGTGYSRLLRRSASDTSEPEPRTGSAPSTVTTERRPEQHSYYSVDGDIASLATFIRRYLTEAGRLQSPKLLIGESYAGFRAPKIAARLQREGGVGLSGLVIVSPVLDFGWHGSSSASNPLVYLGTLPSMAAAVREAKGPVTRADLADVERYAAGEFLVDLIAGESNETATRRVVEKVAAITGLDATLVRQRAGRIDAQTFMREVRRASGEVVSIYDASVARPDPFPSAPSLRGDDAFTGPLSAPMTSAMIDLYRSRIGWKPDGDYRILNREVNGQWNWGRSFSANEAITDLRRALALDGTLEVAVVHGLTDLITPYFRSKILLDQIPTIGRANRLQFIAYPGGHMFYARESSRQHFRRDVAAMVDRVLATRR